MQKNTTATFIEKARKVHGDRYDYSQVEYSHNKAKVIIVCPIHGAFEQTAGTHLYGGNCFKCAGTPKKTTEEFIHDSRAVHGSRYDYSKSVYTTALTKLIIICPIHGEFKQTPNSHLKGCGCIDCEKKRKKTTNSFIQEAIAVHGERFDYSKVVYKNNRTRVCIICPVHGEFWQTPGGHLGGKSGCRICADCAQLSTEEFIRRSRIVHGNKYDYSMVIYGGNKKKVDIICPVHGNFTQRPNRHMRGDGCPNCVEYRGETKIAKWLDDHNISYKRRYSFPECRDKHALLFDFFIPIANLLIEYDGIQHFIAIPHFKDIAGMEGRKRRDNIKNVYATNKNISLLRISYTEFKNIESILEKTLNN